MRKAKLMKLRQPILTDEMCKLADQTQELAESKKRDSYAIFMSIEVENEILKAAVFLTAQIRAGVKTPAYIIFCDKKEDQFLTNDFMLNKWRICLAENLEYFHNYHSDVYINPQDEQILKEYFGMEEKGYYALVYFQRGVLYRKRLRRVKKSLMFGMKK